MPFTHAQFLIGIVLPAALIGLDILLMWSPRIGGYARWSSAPLVAIGFGIAYWIFEPKLGWPPNANVIYLLFYFAAALGILGLIDAIFKPPAFLRLMVLMLLWPLAVQLLLGPLNVSAMDGLRGQLWITGSMLIAAVWALTFEYLSERSPGITAPLLLAAMAAASSILLAMGWHIQSSGALAGALAAMSVAALVVGGWSSRISFSHGSAQTIVLLLLLVLVHGYFYTGDTLTNWQQLWIGLLLVSPLLVFIGDLAVMRRQRPIWRLAARVIPVLIVLSIVCAATIRDYVHAEQAQATMQDE
ncbi:MAG TPA: hypothetical protein VHX86_19185 [Tepidisphaeraceae bacterium]|nr:hypothetical protein [Tepidisphaeraceae bacterium]